MSVPCERCVLSGTGFCDGTIPLPQKSNQVCVCVCVCVCMRVRVRARVSLSVIRYKNSLHLQGVGTGVLISP